MCMFHNYEHNRAKRLIYSFATPLTIFPCPGGSTDAKDNLGGIVGGVTAAVLLFILVGVAIVTLIVFIKKQHAMPRSQTGNK